MNITGTSYLKSLAVRCRIGCLDDERVAPQPLLVDVRCRTDIAAAVATDARQDCVDYVALHGIVTALAESTRYRLLESFAHGIATQALALPHVLEVTVDVRKPHKLPGCDAVGITLTMARGEAG